MLSFVSQHAQVLFLVDWLGIFLISRSIVLKDINILLINFLLVLLLLLQPIQHILDIFALLNSDTLLLYVLL